MLLHRKKSGRTHSQGMDHSFEAHIDLAATDNFSNIRWVVGLQESNLQALILEITLGLGQVQRGVVRRRVP